MSQQVKVYRTLDMRDTSQILFTQADRQSVTDTGGGIFEAGTSESTAITSATASMIFFQLRAKTTATSGDIRAAYIRLYMDGAGAAGEALRAFTTVNAAVTGGTHGGHISLNMGTAANTAAGLAVGMRATLHVLNASIAGKGGSIYGAMSELYADGTGSNFAQATNHAIHRFVVDGNATGKNTAAYAFEFALGTAGAGGSILTTSVTNTNMTATLTGALKVKANGTNYWIPLATAIT